MVIPFKYNWNSFPTTRATYETLQALGHEVTLFNKNMKPQIDYNNYDQVWLVGTGTKLTKAEYKKIEALVIALGLSDPNLYSAEHMLNCDVYITNDLKTYKNHKKLKPIFYNPTSCDKRYHRTLQLKKTTDILTFGVGKHKFIPFRNKVVNELRKLGFRVKVFGRDWDKHPDTHDFIEGQQLIEEINKAKILLDITTRATALGHRVFEGSACGVPVMTIYREDLIKMFQPGEEIFTYYDTRDLINKLKCLLPAKKLLAKVGQNAQHRCYRDHDITIRIKNLLNYLQELKI